jgi:hypothetical protein
LSIASAEAANPVIVGVNVNADPTDVGLPEHLEVLLS